RTLATGSLGGASWWDVATGRRLGPAVAHPHRVNQVLFSPDGSRLLTFTWDPGFVETCRLWDVGSGAPVGAPLWQESRVFCGAFSLDSRLVLAGGFGEVRIWHASSGEPAGRVLKHPGHWVQAALFRPDGQTILTNSSESNKPGTISHWKADTGERI